MTSMAVRTVGDIRFLMKVRLSMIAVRIIFRHPSMAAGAVRPPRRLAGTREAGIHIRVAFYAGNIFVSRFLYFGLIHMHGNFLPTHHFVNVFLPVTLHTNAVRYADRHGFFADFMRSMTVGTGGDGSRLLFPQFTANDFGMDSLYSGVAFHAGLSEIIGGCAGTRIVMGKDEVVVVAIITGGGNNETPLE